MVRWNNNDPIALTGMDTIQGIIRSVLQLCHAELAAPGKSPYTINFPNSQLLSDLPEYRYTSSNDWVRTLWVMHKFFFNIHGRLNQQPIDQMANGAMELWFDSRSGSSFSLTLIERGKQKSHNTCFFSFSYDSFPFTFYLHQLWFGMEHHKQTGVNSPFHSKVVSMLNQD